MKWGGGGAGCWLWRVSRCHVGLRRGCRRRSRGHRTPDMRMPCVAAAQRASWIRLRGALLQMLHGDSSPPSTVRSALTAFDALPFRSPPIDAAWLPTAVDLQHAGLPPPLSSAVDEERVALRAVTHTAGDDRVRLVHARLDASSSLVLESAAPGVPSRVAFTIADERLEWLRRAHDGIDGARVGHGDGHGDDARCEARFRRALFMVLARYDAFAGTHGAGSQACVPPEVFAALEAHFGAARGSVFEAFASPLNHRLVMRDADGGVEGHGDGAAPPRFFSAFPDVDAPFGGAVAAAEGWRDADLRYAEAEVVRGDDGEVQLLERAATLAAWALAMRSHVAICRQEGFGEVG